jgi:hypothetical protein
MHIIDGEMKLTTSSHSNVRHVSPVYGTNGSPTAGSEVSLPVCGFDRKVKVHLAATLFKVQAQSEGWANDEIDEWIRKAVHIYVSQQASIDRIPQSSLVEMPSSILFVGYKPKG